MHSAKLISRLIEDKRVEDLSNNLRPIWDDVWDDDVSDYSRFRLYKTIDKISTIENLGVDFKNKNVLDIGCGDGTALVYLKEKYGISGVGLDISEEVIERTPHDISDLSFETGDHRETGLSGNRFDIVLSWGVVEHFPEYGQALFEAKRVLKDGGALVLIQPNFLSFGVLQKKILELQGRWRFGEQKEFSRKELEELLLSLGYTDIVSFSREPYKKDMMMTHYLDKIMSNIITDWGHYLYMIARK